MAGDWLKVETCTPDKPEVIGIADILGIAPAHAFGSLFLIWRWFDQHTVEGNASFVTKVTIDRLAGNAGFADAMQRVGWLICNDDGTVAVPHFDRHNGETAKQRALTAKRVAKSKAKSNGKGSEEGNAKVTDSALPREEKRREDINTPLPPMGAFDCFWKAWPSSPRKGSKPKCLEVWKRHKFDSCAAQIMTHLDAMKKSPDWCKEGGRFVPAPLTYLNQRRWDGAGLSPGSANVTQFRQRAGQWERYDESAGWFVVPASEVPDSVRSAA